VQNPDWQIKPASAKAEKQWKKAVEQQPDLMAKEKERLKTNPLDRSGNPRRTHQLRGPLATRKIGGSSFEQWQHEITGAGRIWYCADRKNRIVWVTQVDLSHPRET